MIELNESADFQEAVLESPGLVLVDFFTTWCGPCRMLAPVLEQLNNVKIVKVDGDQHQNIVVDQGVAAYPTMIFYRDGQVVGREVGVQSLDYLQDKVDELNGG